MFSSDVEKVISKKVTGGFRETVGWSGQDFRDQRQHQIGLPENHS